MSDDASCNNNSYHDHFWDDTKANCVGQRCEESRACVIDLELEVGYAPTNADRNERQANQASKEQLLAQKISILSEVL